MLGQRIFIAEVAEYLNRRAATIRGWERDKLLPEHLRSHRTERGWRYWTPAQVEEIKEWMAREDMRPGKAFDHYKPTPEEIERHIARTRRPKGDPLDEQGAPEPAESPQIADS